MPHQQLDVLRALRIRPLERRGWVRILLSLLWHVYSEQQHRLNRLEVVRRLVSVKCNGAKWCVAPVSLGHASTNDAPCYSRKNLHVQAFSSGKPVNLSDHSARKADLCRLRSQILYLSTEHLVLTKAAMQSAAWMA